MASHFALLLICVIVQHSIVFPGEAASPCKGDAKYKLTFKALWSQATHPTAYISSAHFSSIIGASHNASYRMWGPNLMASNGIKVMAERGNPNPLKTEITEQKNSGYAHKVIEGPVVNSPGTLTDIQVSVDSHFPLVSVVTMIAPSPDWFVGVDSVDLCDAQTGKFKNNASFDLGPWDSGTDSGKLFDSTNEVTNPFEPIFLITNTMDTVFMSNTPIPTLAIMTFTKTEESVMVPTAKPVVTPSIPLSACEGSAEYRLTFQGLWSRETHPNAYIQSAHFSSIIGASHNRKYRMWAPGQNAGNGVKVVAELGDPNPLKQEITAQIKMGYAYKTISAGTVSSPGTLNDIKVYVNRKYPLVSVITMIAPSPDWFVGVDDVDLCDAQTGKFKDRMSFDLGPWDSGTDSGKLFDSANEVTNPFEPIFLITNTMDTVFMSNSPIPTLARMTFTKTTAEIPTTTGDVGAGSEGPTTTGDVGPTNAASAASGFSLGHMILLLMIGFYFMA